MTCKHTIFEIFSCTQRKNGTRESESNPGDDFTQNIEEYLFHLSVVRNIPFRSKYQYISTKQHMRFLLTLIWAISDLNRELNCWMTSGMSTAGFNACRVFIMLTMTAWINHFRCSSTVRWTVLFSVCSTAFNETLRLSRTFLPEKENNLLIQIIHSFDSYLRISYSIISFSAECNEHCWRRAIRM